MHQMVRTAPMEAPLLAKRAIWDQFCREHHVLERSVPLFEIRTDGVVNLAPLGNFKRSVLQRSAQMESRVIAEVGEVINDYHSGKGVYEGLIYMMFWTDHEAVIPLYIGKSEKYGRKIGNLSANIENIARNPGRFCRWGYNYAYHIGDLSRVVCPGHPATENDTRGKYAKWADKLFVSWPSPSPQLRKETRFWIQAWKHGASGPWIEYGATSLTFLEYLLIGVASDVFTDILLNDEGVNRR